MLDGLRRCDEGGVHDGLVVRLCSDRTGLFDNPVDCTALTSTTIRSGTAAMFINFPSLNAFRLI
jgi:hypothetical protein